MLDPCIATYTNVCLEGGDRLHFDQTSTCDGQPCTVGWVPRSRFPHHNGTRFPIKELLRSRGAGAKPSASPDGRRVALLPSGVPSPERSMGHLLYDSFLLEIAIARRANISIVLGPSRPEPDEPSNLIYELRRRLFAHARFQPALDGCFSALYSYSFSCDRKLDRYPRSAAIESIRTLRALAPFSETATKSVILYGRSDTSRRRLVNISAHHAALRRRFDLPGRRVVLWDEFWCANRSRDQPLETFARVRRGRRERTVRRPTPCPHHPSVDDQIQLVRNAERLITPHGVFPSVWSLFLPPGARVSELMSACFFESYVPKFIRRGAGFGLRHSYLVNLKREFLGHGGQRLRGCQSWPFDPDLRIEPAALIRHLDAARYRQEGALAAPTPSSGTSGAGPVRPPRAGPGGERPESQHDGGGEKRSFVI